MVGSNAEGSNISNCHSTGEVAGDDEAGGLVGWNAGNISDCHSAGEVTGSDEVGGLVGDNDGSVSCCYSSAQTTGGTCTGGLVGLNHGSVMNCYSSGTITTEESGVAGGGLIGGNEGDVSCCYSIGAVTGEAYCLGGLVGLNLSGLAAYNGDGSVEDSFWDTEISGQTVSDGGVGLMTAEMQDPEWIGLQDWANNPNWVLDPYQDYPRLAWEGTPGQTVPEPIIDWILGEGTKQTPYQIDSPSQLVKISKASLFWDKDFLLTHDLDLSGIQLSRAVIPDFTGNFEGNGHMVFNLRIAGISDLGLFGRLGSGATVSNLCLETVDVKGIGCNVGGLVGYNRYGSVWNCYSTGAVAGNGSVGGLAGCNRYGSVSNSYSSGAVTGEWAIGGLVGGNDGSVSNSYSNGAVTGEWAIGGLVGGNIGSVSNCYSTGEVTSDDDVGGLIGWNDDDDGVVVESFWDIETSGQTRSDGGVGLATAEMWDIGTYLNAGWDFLVEAENGIEDIWWIEDGVDYPHLWWELTGIDAAVGVYLLWSSAYQRHFFTIDEAECEAFLQDTAGAWQDEGIAYYAFADDREPNVAAVYRFYAESTHSHFYTINETEKDKLIENYSHVWAYQGVGFYVYSAGQQPADASPVYRFWSPVLGYHFYTISESEKDKLITDYPDAWIYEGVAWYAYK